MDDRERFKVFADPHRQHIVERLSSSPATVRELTEGLALSQPAVSHHLRLLREAEIVRFEPSGASNVYYVDPKGLDAMRAWLDRHWSLALASYQAALNDQENQDGNPD
jgi:DNA-binding transcriptional ArsR family regulator